MQVPPGVHAQDMRRRQMLYLHGFASSPRSSKAGWFTARAREAGIPLACPDLNGEDFESLTITRQLDHVDGAIDAMPDGPVVLVGSSLGAFVALFAAERRAGSVRAARHPIDALVFLAPALDLAPGLARHFGPAAMGEWRASGRLEVFHYGENRTRSLGYGFFADAEQYNGFAARDTTPTLVYQGTRDETVEASMVARWASTRPHVTLHLVDDDHQLLGSLDSMWAGIRQFLGLTS
jgi:pimeloyl-ACP methyl ester carboxylesterase